MIGELDFDSDTQEALDEDARHDEEQEGPKPQAWTVAVYLQDRAYGGPEEGGWYYDCGELQREFWSLTRVFGASKRAEALAYARELNEGPLMVANEGRPEISSVLSEGRYHAEVWPDVPPQGYPATRPHYE